MYEKYNRQALLAIGSSKLCRVLDIAQIETIKELRIFRKHSIRSDFTATPPPKNGLGKRCAEEEKGVKRGGTRARPAASPTRPVMPSIILANLRSEGIQMAKASVKKVVNGNAPVQTSTVVKGKARFKTKTVVKGKATVNTRTVVEKKAPVKTNAKWSSGKKKDHFCVLCGEIYSTKDGHTHMQSYLHHREFKIALGRDISHWCQACQTSSIDLSAYAKHVDTPEHKLKLNLLRLCEKPIALSKILSPEDYKIVVERNQNLKSLRKKTRNKRKKKMLQERNLRNTCQQNKHIKQEALLGTLGQHAGSSGSRVELVQNKRQAEELDFTSDDVSQLGATLYEEEPVRTTTSQPSPGPNPAGSTPPAPPGGPCNTDVGVMLRLIRKALGTPTAHTVDSGSGVTQKISIKQETSQMVAGKRQQRKKGIGIPRLGVDQENPPLCPVDFTEDEHLYWDSYSATSNNGQGNPARVSVKGEPGELDTSPPERRKRKGDDGLSSTDRSRKKRMSKSNKGTEEVDQLLTVSLREEEVCRALEELDRSLVQARTALQATYAEVQRLLALRQQFSTEVSGLRAKRIEILHGMQGSSGPSTAADPAAPSMPPSRSPHSPFACLPAPSPLLQLSAATSPLSAAPLKQERGDPPQAAPLLIHASRLLPHTPPWPEAQPTAERATNTAPAPPLPAVKQSSSPPLAPKREPEEEEESDDSDESEGSLVIMEPRPDDIIHIDESDSDVSPKKTPPAPDRENRAPLQPTTTSTQGVKELTSVPMTTSEPDQGPPQEPLALGPFQNHAGPVHDLQIYGGRLYSCSGDNTARAYCLVTKECQGVFEGHSSTINCLLVAPAAQGMLARLYTGSSDKTVRCFSIKSQKFLDQVSFPDRVLCLHISWGILYVGLANGSVVSLHLKTLKELDVLECHGPRGVSCLGTSQEGARRVLLVGSYDSTISVRDAKSGLMLRSLQGHTKTVLCMKVVNDLVFSGSSDTGVHAHNIHTGELVRIYKGHSHSVTSIIILGKVMVTACLDKLLRVYELQSHDRLQVYGGHSDMVMCMAIHKSVIYSGCYDGSIQASKLNLMKNYRCWWHGCSLIFGVEEHLTQHLLRDHSNAHLATVACRWRGCDAFFPTQDAVQQKLPKHVQSHVEMDSQLNI
ncbi:zinc finger protein 106-like isoform X1 [Gadus chalcogrammus]|uniref:zinc finger protein 106-like isoform X1 n=2 Tax=Gadus chalcogrammus TaxID=1042646 RepID=UPI0024C4D547|nr:zinc finger protein 106-like isoform X1 [Gadus chalcogrammus]